ncbi:hypothetical protein [Paenibacillus sp. NPDC057967]|uniref:hypothetical protein n=1 Tax=Paenibacillus sp. NPDC057967 TaxID=3346293 RepID=UPI0036DC235C
MKLPTWFKSILQSRLDDVFARVALDPEFRRIREEKDLAFQKLFSDRTIISKPEFSEWEDICHYKQEMENEYLYWQGMQDGAQLAYVIMALIMDDEQETEE